MNRQIFDRLLQIATDPETHFDQDGTAARFSMLAYEAGELIRNRATMISLEQATALIKWQVQCLDGSLDMPEVENTFAFMKPVQISDGIPERRATRRRPQPALIPGKPQDNRFSELE